MSSTDARAAQSMPLIEHLARAGRRAAEVVLVPAGLRPRQVVTLKLLSEHGPVSQQALGELLCLDPSNVVGLLNELEDRGLTVRRRDPADRRRHIVELSAGGEAELDATYALLDRIEDQVLGTLTAEERATLHHLLERAVGADRPPSGGLPSCAGTSPCDGEPLER
ncbi:MarR family winged helix-turn-helix transcriptional regulator [Streptacidiphilus sp. N1-10]|uniref:MarR family winged helix-turn-helix transcriptional regulator n=1 Tax=Streptacidiphilus jeojiensis TaxID=3229225 RepID=A0ABV6XFU3_9ACTN